LLPKTCFLLHLSTISNLKIDSRMNRTATFFFLFLLMLASSAVFSQLSVNGLKTEYLENPVGIDETRPRFVWQLKSGQPGTLQKAFQLVVGTEEAEVKSGTGKTWNSGTTISSVVPVVYGGTELQSFTRYFWSVRVQDESGTWSGWSPVAFFETGMMDQRNWKGKWVTDTYDYNQTRTPFQEGIQH
jgi:alpha-L-rhamnosidase